jgi:hypothetical protein
MLAITYISLKLINKINLWKIDKNKDIIGINTNHKYYYQVQGQLHVTGRRFGIIAYWTNKV